MKDLRLVRKLGSLLMLAASIFGVSAAVPASVIPAAQASACEWQGGYWNHVTRQTVPVTWSTFILIGYQEC